jgi:hypothetical protein
MKSCRPAIALLCAWLPVWAWGAETESTMPGMAGMFGPYPMTREASGTSWQPESTPMEGIHHMGDEWTTMTHGVADFIYDDQGGPRGGTKSFSSSMLMFMGEHAAGDGTLGVHGMISLDPLMGKAGYPELLQTGETADGVNPLVDRQHPHNLFMEMAASYSHPLGAGNSVFVYAGLPGEPALGPAAYMHRFSGMDNPEAPITHHWLDSTHVTSGVTTLGFVHTEWKLEVSAYHGREPDQFRYRLEPGRLDSSSMRLTYNPTPNWSAQISHGHIVSPEQLEPGINVDRTTASATYNKPLDSGDWQTTLAWGRNTPSAGRESDAYLLESALAWTTAHTFFVRVESVNKDELFLPGTPLFGESFRVAKASIGYIRDFEQNGYYAIGIGGLVSKFALPSALAAYYGENPTAGMVFVRLKIK